MYGNATDADVDASWLAMPGLPGRHDPAAVAPGGSAAGAWSPSPSRLAVHIALFGAVVRCGVVVPGRRRARVHRRARASSARRRCGRSRAAWRSSSAWPPPTRPASASSRCSSPLTIVAFALGRVGLRPQPHGARAQGPHPGAARGARRARAPRGRRPTARASRASSTPCCPPPGRADPAGRRRPRDRRRRRRRHGDARADRGGQPRHARGDARDRRRPARRRRRRPRRADAHVAARAASCATRATPRA